MTTTALRSDDAATRTGHNRLRRALLGVVVATVALLLGASPSYAATGTWAISQNHGTVYVDGDWSRAYFQRPQTTLPANPVITSTVVALTPYANGFATDTITICYQQQYSLTDFACLADFQLTGPTTMTTNLFNGQNAKGTITVRHTLTGGTYPAFGTSAQDTVTVNYTY